MMVNIHGQGTNNLGNRTRANSFLDYFVSPSQLLNVRDLTPKSLCFQFMLSDDAGTPILFANLD